MYHTSYSNKHKTDQQMWMHYYRLNEIKLLYKTVFSFKCTEDWTSDFVYYKKVLYQKDRDLHTQKILNLLNSLAPNYLKTN